MLWAVAMEKLVVEVWATGSERRQSTSGLLRPTDYK